MYVARTGSVMGVACEIPCGGFLYGRLLYWYICKYVPLRLLGGSFRMRESWRSSLSFEKVFCAFVRRLKFAQEGSILQKIPNLFCPPIEKAIK